MKFRGKDKNPKENSCASCASKTGNKGLPTGTPEQMKKLKEMMKKKIKQKMCPFIKECDQKVLDIDFQVMCCDAERSPEMRMMHLAGKHIFEACKTFAQLQREKEGKTPLEWARKQKKKVK